MVGNAWYFLNPLMRTHPSSRNADPSSYSTATRHQYCPTELTVTERLQSTQNNVTCVYYGVRHVLLVKHHVS